MAAALGLVDRGAARRGVGTACLAAAAAETAADEVAAAGASTPLVARRSLHRLHQLHLPKPMEREAQPELVDPEHLLEAVRRRQAVERAQQRVLERRQPHVVGGDFLVGLAAS